MSEYVFSPATSMSDLTERTEAGLYKAYSTEALRELVHIFYAKVRRDSLIGPVFNDIVADWPEHLELLTRFWDSVMTGAGTYSGRPMPRHFHLPITRPHFERWLDLWVETTGELFEPHLAEALRVKAWRIGQTFEAAMAMRESRGG